ncbi:MAG: tetratricopeptide repeat protein [Candidatus Hydrogenedentes bacterium]|nr:tetratricopeptide repeat protein [Candidatus Hydrogenedentota bacterium]
MDARTAELRFNDADTLYREGRYDEALDRLIELDEAFPNTPNVLFPLARCMRRLGRHEEALSICDDLITRCGDLRAVQLREFIRTHRNAATDPTPLPASAMVLEGLHQHAHAGVLDDLLGQPESPPPLPAGKESRRPNWVIIGSAAAVLLVVLLGAFFAFSGGRQEGAPLPAPDAAAVPLGADMSLVTMLGITLIMQVVALTAALFFTLRLRGKLPYDSLTDNLINTVFMSVAVTLLNSTCIGVIASIVILYKYYELAVAEFIILFAVFAAALFAVGLVYFGASSAFG